MTAIGPDSSRMQSLYEQLREQAALADSFRPADLLAALSEGPTEGLSEDDLVLAGALSALRADCSVKRDAEGQLWTLRPALRRKVLAGLPRDASPQGDTAIAHAMIGSTGYQTAAIGRLIRRAEEGRPPPSAVLARRLHGLERAGPAAPAHALLPALRSALTQAEQQERHRAVLADGIFGREPQLAALADWIAQPQTSPPVRALHLSGLPGSGKTFLLHAAIQAAQQGERAPLTLWLDFDRGGLSVIDATAFHEEISRQIGDALPHAAGDLRLARLAAARERAALNPREAAWAQPRALIAAVGRAVSGQDHPVLLVLDTIEVLRARGETAVMRLLEHLDRLVLAGVAPMAVISAGREDALDPVPERHAASIQLGALPEAAARDFLAMLGVPDTARAPILALAAGSPLLLKLGARAQAQGLSLSGDSAGSRDTSGAFLYRAILSRLDPPLDALAQAGLALHRLQASDLHIILAPALDLPLTEAKGRALFHDLASQHWLVEPDPEPGWLRYRHDIRAGFLPLLYRDQPQLAHRINQIAQEVLAETDPTAALYHRLQLTRAGLPLPPIDPMTASRFGPTLTEELPQAARNALLRARGDRSDSFRAGRAPDDDAPRPQAKADGPITARAFAYDHDTGRLIARPGAQPRPISPALIADLSLMLANGDRREAAFLIDTALTSPFRADDPGAVPILAFLWLSGAWASVLRLWRAMGAPVETNDPTQTRILREIDAEARFTAARRRLPGRPLPPSSGRSALMGMAVDLAQVVDDPAGASLTRAEGTARAAMLLHPWWPRLQQAPGDPGATVLSEAALRRERAGLSLAPSISDKLESGLLIAALMPHLLPLTARASGRSGTAQAAWLASLADRLPRILQLQAPWVVLAPDAIARAAENRFDMLDLLAAGGVLADAAHAMAVTLRDPETQRIAASAETWRRLSHGLWSLSARPPKGWIGPPAPDAATLDLALRLSQDPGAGQQLAALWLGDQGARRLADRVAGHLSAPDLAGRCAIALADGLPWGLAASQATAHPEARPPLQPD